MSKSADKDLDTRFLLKDLREITLKEIKEMRKAFDLAVKEANIGDSISYNEQLGEVWNHSTGKVYYLCNTESEVKK